MKNNTSEQQRHGPHFEKHLFHDDGTFPNNAELAVVIYKAVFHPQSHINPTIIEEAFRKNHWVHSWRNGLYSMHHYHSSAHEVLGIYSGWVEAMLGGPQGKLIKASAGDVIIIPAGVSHKNTGQASDFKVVGAYPKGQTWDMNFGRKGERPKADKQINSVPLPASDPVFGNDGVLQHLWNIPQNSGSRG